MAQDILVASAKDTRVAFEGVSWHTFRRATQHVILFLQPAMATRHRPDRQQPSWSDHRYTDPELRLLRSYWAAPFLSPVKPLTMRMAMASAAIPLPYAQSLAWHQGYLNGHTGDSSGRMGDPDLGERAPCLLQGELLLLKLLDEPCLLSMTNRGGILRLASRIQRVTAFDVGGRSKIRCRFACDAALGPFSVRVFCVALKFVALSLRLS